MGRLLVSILLGAAVTFALFFFMAFLVSNSDRSKEDQQENIIVEVNTTPPKSSAETRHRVPPPPPPPPKTPPKPQAPEPEASNDSGGISFNLPSVQIGAHLQEFQPQGQDSVEMVKQHLLCESNLNIRSKHHVMVRKGMLLFHLVSMKLVVLKMLR